MNNEGKILSILVTLQADIGELKSNVSKLNENQMHMEKKLISVEGKVDVMDARLNSVESKFDAVENGIGSLEGKFDTMDNRLGSFEGKFDTMDNRLGSLESKFDTVGSRLGSLEDKFDTVENRLGFLEGKFDTVENRLGAIEEQTAILTEFRIEVMQKFQDLNDSFTSIQEILGDHEVQIRNLKRRIPLVSETTTKYADKDTDKYTDK